MEQKDKKLIADDWRVRLEEWWQVARQIHLDSPLVAFWVFLKSVALGVVLDLLVDLWKPVKAMWEWFWSGTPYEVNQIITNYDVTKIVDETGQSTMTQIDTLRTTVSDTIQTVFTTRIPWSEAQIPAPEFAISYVFWIIAFAAGRMSTRVGNIAGHIVGLIFLYIALLPEFSQYSGFMNVLPAAIGKMALYGVAAWWTIRDNSLQYSHANRVNTKGAFIFTMFVDKRTAENVRELIYAAVNQMEGFTINDIAMAKVDIGNKTFRNQVVATLSGNKSKLPLVRDALLEVFKANNPSVTKVINTG